MEIIRKSDLKQLQIERFESIINMLKNDFGCNTRSKQAEALNLNNDKEISDLLHGHVNMSPGKAEVISKSLLLLGVNISPGFILGIIDENIKTDGHVKKDFDLSLLKYINDTFGNITLICSFDVSRNKKKQIDFELFDNNTRVDGFNLEDQNVTVSFIHIDGNGHQEEEKHTMTVLSVKIANSIYSYFEFRVLYRLIEKNTRNTLENYNFVLSDDYTISG